jgi:hypothetical protein
VGPPAPRRPRADRRGPARLLRRPAGALQDPALRAHRRRVPDDRHRQGPQGGDARALGRDPRPRVTV